MTSIFKNVPEPFEPKLLPFDLKDIITDIEIINLMKDASKLLGELVELKILNTSDNKRNKIYYCPSILLNTGK